MKTSNCSICTNLVRIKCVFSAYYTSVHICTYEKKYFFDLCQFSAHLMRIQCVFQFSTDLYMCAFLPIQCHKCAFDQYVNYAYIRIYYLVRTQCVFYVSIHLHVFSAYSIITHFYLFSAKCALVRKLTLLFTIQCVIDQCALVRIQCAILIRVCSEHSISAYFVHCSQCVLYQYTFAHVQCVFYQYAFFPNKNYLAVLHSIL